MMSNFKNMMKQAQEMQTKMLEIQEKMAEVNVDGTSGGGMVVATVNGKGEPRGLKIDPSLVDSNEIEMLEDLIVAAFSDAKTKAETRMSEEMSNLTGGMSLPENFKLPF